jgi:thioredoxin 1
MEIEINDQNFDDVVLKSDKIVLVDFWAEWCGPCKMVSPIILEIGENYNDQVFVGELNVDENPNTTMRFGIRNIPTVLFFKNGKVVDKQVGAVPKNKFVAKLEVLL